MATVMVVDDVSYVRQRVRRLLAGAGYDVVEASDGIEAIDKYRETQPDAVLLDITMPRMDGMTALKAIRRFDPAARVAMVTAVDKQSAVLEAVQSGARDFVVKPFREERVLAAVNKLLA